MDINLLLAREQMSLLRARFLPSGAGRDRLLAEATRFADRLGVSLYPHRAVAFVAAA